MQCSVLKVSLVAAIAAPALFGVHAFSVLPAWDSLKAGHRELVFSKMLRGWRGCRARYFDWNELCVDGIKCHVAAVASERLSEQPMNISR
jgi:hypothetical protein